MERKNKVKFFLKQIKNTLDSLVLSSSLPAMEEEEEAKRIRVGLKETVNVGPDSKVGLP